MSTLDDFVTVSITTTSQTPTQVGFGTPMVLGYHTAWVDRVRTYTKLADMVTDGITATGIPAGTYAAAAKIFSQNPKVKQIKVGRRTNPYTQIIVLTPAAPVAGDTEKFDFGALGTTAVTLTRTVPGSPTLAAECTAIKALIDGLALGVTVTTPGSANVTITANVPGQLFDVLNRSPNLGLAVATTAPAGISTDLDACQAADQDWYGLTIDSNSQAEITAVAAWTETQLKIFGYNTADTAVTVAGSGDVCSALQTSGYFRTFGLFDGSQLLSYAAAGWLGEELPYAPGSSSYALKTLKAVTVDSTLSTTASTFVLAKNGNSYTKVAGLSITNPGKTAAGEYIDIAVGRDWMQARLKERIFGALTSVRKIPYTDAGVDIIVAQVQAQMADGIRVGYLAASPAPIVTAPKVADVSVANRSARLLPNVTFSANLAGAIQAVQISGTISV